MLLKEIKIIFLNLFGNEYQKYVIKFKIFALSIFLLVNSQEEDNMKNVMYMKIFISILSIK